MQDSWQLLARRRVLVEKGLLLPLIDKICGHEVVSIIGKDNEPVLFCGHCQSKTYPGTNFWERINEELEDNEWIMTQY